MHETNGANAVSPRATPRGSLSDWRAAYAERGPTRVRYHCKAMDWIDATTLERKVLLTDHPETGEPVEVVGMVFADGSTWPDNDC